MALHIMPSSGEAFVYCWTDKRDNKFYFGYHKGKEDDGYVCSSKLMMEQYKQRSQDFVREIIAHGTKEECISLESELLHTIDAKRLKNVYNQTNGDTNFVCKGHTSLTIDKISNSCKGKPCWLKGKHLTKQHADNISKTLHETLNNPGYVHPNKGKKSWSKGLSGEEFKKHYINGFGDHSHTPESKRNLSNSRKQGIAEGRIIPWNKGKIFPELRGQKWHHSGNVERKYAPGTAPIGFILGRAPKHIKRKTC